MLAEWDVLKTYVLPIVANNDKSSYLEVWKTVFWNDMIKKEYKNIFLILEILLVTPFTNANDEIMFLCMAHIKTDWHNRLGQDCLDAL